MGIAFHKIFYTDERCVVKEVMDRSSGEKHLEATFVNCTVPLTHLMCYVQTGNELLRDTRDGNAEEDLGGQYILQFSFLR